MTRRSRSRDKDPVELIKVKGPNGEDVLRVASEEEIIAGLKAEAEQAKAKEDKKEAAKIKEEADKTKKAEETKKAAEKAKELQKAIAAKNSEKTAKEAEIKKLADDFKSDQGTTDPTNQLDFYWVRHGESVSNLFNNKPIDLYTDKKFITEFEDNLKKFIKDDYVKVNGMHIQDEYKYKFVLLTAYNQANPENVALFEAVKAKLADSTLGTASLGTASLAEAKHIYVCIDAATSAMVGYIYGDVPAAAAPAAAASAAASKTPAVPTSCVISKIETFATDPVGNVQLSNMQLSNTIIKKYVSNMKLFYKIDKFTINANANAVANANANAVADNTRIAFLGLGYSQYTDDKFTKVISDNNNTNLPFYFKLANDTDYINPEDYPLVKSTYDYINKMQNGGNNTILNGVCKPFIVPADDNFDFVNGGDVINNKCITKIKETVKDVKSKSTIAEYYSYWLKNFLPTNFLFQPTLSGIGIKQAQALGKQLTKTADNKAQSILSKLDISAPEFIIITSASARAMMTAYAAAQTAASDKPITIFVVPYITEKENDAQFVYNNTNLHDFTNYGIHPDVIENVAAAIKTYFDKVAPNTQVTFDCKLYTGERDKKLGTVTPDTTLADKTKALKSELQAKKTALAITIPIWLTAEVSKKAALGADVKTAEDDLKKAEDDLKNAEKELTEFIKTNDYYKAKLAADEAVRQSDVKNFFTWFQGKFDDTTTSTSSSTSTSTSTSSSTFKDKKQILAFCHGYVIKELHKITGIDLIKDIVKLVYEEIGQNREMFNTWDANTSVFTHPYFIKNSIGKRLTGLESIENACLVNNSKALDQIKQLREKTTDLDKDIADINDNEKALAIANPSASAAPTKAPEAKAKAPEAKANLEPMYGYLLTILGMTEKASDLSTNIKDIQGQLEQMKDKKSPTYAQLVTILKDKYDKGSLGDVYKKLKEKYLSSPDTFRAKAAGKLLPEDRFGDQSIDYISLSPESLRGKIAKITHGYVDQILGITLPMQAGGGGGVSAATTKTIINYLKQLYTTDENIQEDPVNPSNREKYIDEILNANFNNCHFKCNQQDPAGTNAIKERYERFEIKLQDSDINKCNNDPITDPKTDPKQYFAAISTMGSSYFFESYDKYFGNGYEEDDWESIKTYIFDNKKASVDESVTPPNTAICIFGPAELLYPFSDSEKFLVLSHMDWTPNINFNYVVDILCKKKELFFILPTGETNNAIQDGINRFSLASNCKKIARATLSELFVINDLEKNNIVEITQVSNEYNIPNNILEPKPYTVVIFHVTVKNVDALCADPSITEAINYTKTAPAEGGKSTKRRRKYTRRIKKHIKKYTKKYKNKSNKNKKSKTKKGKKNKKHRYTK